MSKLIIKKVLENESEAIRLVSERIDDNFLQAVEMLVSTVGRIIVTGMGKPGFIAQKISATLASTGSPSLYLHPAEALHGDLGRVTDKDIIIAFSNSGETDEVVRLIPIIKKIGAKLIAVTGNTASSLALGGNCVLDSSVEKEACPMGLAPTTSTTVMLAIGDALAIALLKKKNFKPQDFALFHPGGLLGKKLLLKVADIMRPASETAIVQETQQVKEVLVEITKMRGGSASVVDTEGCLVGIFTDGDLRRHLESSESLLDAEVSKAMTADPITISPEKLAAEAFEILRERAIDEIPVVDSEGRPVGLLDVQDILKAGLV